MRSEFGADSGPEANDWISLVKRGNPAMLV